MLEIRTTIAFNSKKGEINPLMFVGNILYQKEPVTRPILWDFLHCPSFFTSNIERATMSL